MAKRVARSSLEAKSAGAEPWGPANFVGETISGMPFDEASAARQVGHSVILGPTRSGKTVLAALLAPESEKAR